MGTKGATTAAVMIAATAMVGGAFFLGMGSSAVSNPTSSQGFAQQQVQRPHIDVVFALDTTSSMSGMIAGAKQKIWSLANEISSGQPRPIVRFGLVGYRDRGDEYITKVTNLSDDMDEMYEQLMAFQAKGGGDAPEHVNQALADSLDKMDWKQGDKVLRIVFLVGDAPPHNDYEDGLNSSSLAKRAKEKGIFINTIRTGKDFSTGEAWKTIASLAGGQFHSLDRSGGMVAVTTPYDDKMARLNRALADTSIAYGSPLKREKMKKKVSNRYAMPSSVAANAASYSSKSVTGGLGAGDLLEEIASGRVSADSLSDDKLGMDMSSMSPDDRVLNIVAKQKKRKLVREKIKKLSKERELWVKKNTENKGGMDEKMMEAVKEQGASAAGVRWK